MITDMILLAVLLAVVLGIVELVSVVQPSSTSSTSSSTPASTGPTSSASNNASSNTAGSSTSSSAFSTLGGNTIDWQAGQINLKTNMRPVTQQDLLEKAQQTGMDGGRFVSQHAQSFSFGKKDA